jgi:hypothetical protein
VPPQDGAGSDDEPQSGEAPGRQRPGQQRQPCPIRPRQPRVSPWPLAQGDSELMAQDQDLGVLPPRLPPGQAQQRHGAGDDEEDQFQAHKPKIIARTARCRPAHRPPSAGAQQRRSRESAQVTQVFGTHRISGLPSAVARTELRRQCRQDQRVRPLNTLLPLGGAPRDLWSRACSWSPRSRPPASRSRSPSAVSLSMARQDHDCCWHRLQVGRPGRGPKSRPAHSSYCPRRGSVAGR